MKVAYIKNADKLRNEAGTEMQKPGSRVSWATR